MSSDDDLHDIDEGELGHSVGDSSKRRKVLRACDVCRRKKIRCDAHNQPNTRCTHCVSFKLDCTFIEGAKKRGPPKGYIDDLEKRCDLLERLLAQVAPHVDLENQIGPSFNKDTWVNVKGSQHGRGLRALKPVGPLSAATMPPSPSMKGTPAGVAVCGRPNPMLDNTLDLTALDSDEERNYPDGNGGLTKHLEEKMEEMNIGFEKRFHGKSSGVTLVQAAMNLKEEATGSRTSIHMKMRPMFWRPKPWEWMSVPMPPIETIQFPPDEIIDSLVDLCFRHMLVIFPVVHRPTFEKNRKANKHKTDISFAKILLAVCAIGSRFSEDQRVCLTSPSGEPQWHSAGWKYFTQVTSLKKPILTPAGLSDLQLSVLMALYLQGTSSPHASWLIVGIGLRYAQDIGAHREKVYGNDFPFENQMWKRTFWSLVALDRITSAGLGRPIGVTDEDIDTDLPLEVDDEHYDEVAKEWKQPEGKPSYITAFNNYVKLAGILAYAIRTIYSINKSKVHLGFVGPEWETHTVSELDSALNSWLDTVPDHLKWDPEKPDSIFYIQSGILRVTYHYVQITIHRPFIPMLAAASKKSGLGFPSLAICTNAARSASHVLEAISTRYTQWSPLVYITAFTTGAVLIVSIFGIKKTGLNVDVSNQVADVHRCINILRKAEERWVSAGKLRDIMTELLNVNDMPLPQNTPTPPDTTSRKRDREESEDPSDGVTAVARSVPSMSPMMEGAKTSRSDSGMTPQAVSNTPYQISSFSDPSSFSAPQQWLPFTGTLNAPPEQTWENFHLTGATIPGTNPDIPRVSGISIPTDTSYQGLLSPNSLFQELVSTFNPSTALMPDPSLSTVPDQGFWGAGSQNDWSWLNDTSLFGVSGGAQR